MCALVATASREKAFSAAKPSDWQVEVDRTEKAEWSEMLDLFDDANIYQTWSYGAVRWGGKNLSHLVLKRNGEVAAIAQVRIMRLTGMKFGMAYLRWGPLCHRYNAELESEVVLQMADALRQEYVIKRRLLLQILPNAFIGSSRAEMFKPAFSGFTSDPLTSANIYRTFVLDISPPVGELRRKLDPKWRNKLAGAERNGLKVTTGTGSDAYRSFCRMYKQMRSRKTFSTTVDIDQFGQIQLDLPESQRMQILICEQAGVPVAGVVASAMGDSAIYILGATSDAGLKAKGSYLLQWTLIAWLKQNGVRWYDLGGIDPEANSGVYQFKKGLSGADVCQLPPLAACDSVFSSALMKTGLAIQNTVRRVRTGIVPAGSRGF